MRVHSSATDSGPSGPAGPAGPGGPSLPLGPTGPCSPCPPGGPVTPRSPVRPIGPSGPCLPLGPVMPSTPSCPLIPFSPSHPGGPVGPMGPVLFSFSSIFISTSESDFLSSSFIWKTFSYMVSFNFFIISTLFSTRARLIASACLRRSMRCAFDASCSFCFFTASLSSTGHIGHSAFVTPTSPNLMMVGGGGGAFGAVLMFTWPISSP
mmetsp:Transcript_51795/g.105418  ORF Transcript_51795/g.105418 Transcript_51795/m.105418 type:complete len:208 (-) Transcript_51795:345-968(-)